MLFFQPAAFYPADEPGEKADSPGPVADDQEEYPHVEGDGRYDLQRPEMYDVRPRRRPVGHYRISDE